LFLSTQFSKVIGARNGPENDDRLPKSKAAGSLPTIASLNYHEGFQPVRIGRRLFLFTGRPVEFMAVGTLVMKNRSSVGAAQQLLADDASALVANIQHKHNSDR
jgi:hypothetical protein